MSRGRLCSIAEGDTVLVPLDGVTPGEFTVVNHVDVDLAFKMKLTHADLFATKPNKGVLSANSSVRVAVSARPDWNTDPSALTSAPRLMIQCNAVHDETLVEKIKMAIVAAAPVSAVPLESSRIAQQEEPASATSQQTASSTVISSRPPSTIRGAAIVSSQEETSAAPPPQPPASPATATAIAERDSAGSVDRFTIQVTVSEFLSTAVTSAKLYTINWKRGSASGFLPPRQGSGGRVEFRNSFSLDCKTAFKPDGSVVKRLLQFVVLSGEVPDDELRPEDVATKLSEVVGTVKVDASAYVDGPTRTADLPMRLADGSEGVLTVGVAMEPIATAPSAVDYQEVVVNQPTGDAPSAGNTNSHQPTGKPFIPPPPQRNDHQAEAGNPSLNSSSGAKLSIPPPPPRRADVRSPAPPAASEMNDSSPPGNDTATTRAPTAPPPPPPPQKQASLSSPSSPVDASGILDDELLDEKGESTVVPLAPRQPPSARRVDPATLLMLEQAVSSSVAQPLPSATTRGGGGALNNPLGGDGTSTSSGGALPTFADGGGESNIFVTVRVRPILSRVEAGDVCWTVADDRRSLRDQEGHSYEYDRVFIQNESNMDVHNAISSRFVTGSLDGINGTLFMYGQTASGKTHTMFGEVDEDGLVPLIVKDIFSTMASRTEAAARNGSTVKFQVSAGYFEIYNEVVNDLLDVSKKNLQVRATKEGFSLEGLTLQPIQEAQAALDVIKTGSANKIMGQSVLNDRSSRSHTIFQLRVKCLQEGGGQRRVTSSELNLVDLAGSETLQAEADATNRKETSHINLSLSFLKRVISELAHKEKFVSYRNSQLTKVLKQSLGGNSRTALICCVTPASEHRRDTRNTLSFGTTAKSVVLTVRANVAQSQAGAVEEVKRLRAQLTNCLAVIQEYRSMDEEMTRLYDDNDRLHSELGRSQSMLQRAKLLLKDARSKYATGGGGGGSLAVSHSATMGGGAAAASSPQPSRPEEIDKEGGGGGALADAGREPSASQYEDVPRSQSMDAQAQDRMAAEAVDDFLAAMADEESAPAQNGEAQGGSASSLQNDALDSATAAAERSESTSSAVPPPPSSMQLAGLPRNRPSPGGTVPPPPSATQLSAVPKTRPTVGPNAIPLTEEQQLRRELTELKIAQRQLLMRKNEEIRQLLDQQRTVVEEIPEAQAKEERLVKLLDQIHSFLHYGTAVKLVDLKQNTLVKAFLHLHTDKGETKIAWSPVDVAGKRVRDQTMGSVAIKDCKRVIMGQFGEAFVKLGRNEEIAPFSRCSFSVICKKKQTLDVMCSNEADFEAWIVALNKLLGNSAEWPEPLAIATLPDVEHLDEEEKKFCSVVNITPKAYLRARTMVAQRGSKILTLFDVRSCTQLDLYHSQRLFFFMRCRGWIAQATVFYPTQSFTGYAFTDVVRADEEPPTEMGGAQPAGGEGGSPRGADDDAVDYGGAAVEHRGGDVDSVDPS